MAAATAALYEFWIHDFCDAYLTHDSVRRTRTDACCLRCWRAA